MNERNEGENAKSWLNVSVSLVVVSRCGVVEYVCLSLDAARFDAYRVDYVVVRSLCPSVCPSVCLSVDRSIDSAAHNSDEDVSKFAVSLSLSAVFGSKNRNILSVVRPFDLGKSRKFDNSRRL